jgi:hypothetical protein
MNKFVTSIAAKLYERGQKYPTRKVRSVFSKPSGLQCQSDSVPASGGPVVGDGHDSSTLIALRLGTVSKKRSPGLFSAERVARARGFWLITLLLFNLVLWGGLGWIALHLWRHL